MVRQSQKQLLLAVSSLGIGNLASSIFLLPESLYVAKNRVKLSFFNNFVNKPRN